MSTIDNEPNPANLFELTAEDMRLTYTTSSHTGQPQFYYQDEQRNLTFSGDEIDVLHSEMGVLITITLEVVYDAYRRTLTLLVPQVNLKQEEPKSSVSTLAVLTTHHTHLGGTNLVTGALETYAVVALEGMAKFVKF